MCEKICQCVGPVHLCCLSLNTVILQEHSNCPIHRPRGPFIAPMTKRSILQHQRCQLPLFKQTIRRRVRWAGWTMLEMTIPGLSLPLSPTFSVYSSWCRAGQRSQTLRLLSQSPKSHQSLFLPADVLLLQLFQTLDCMTNKLHLLFKEKEGEEEGGGCIGSCKTTHTVDHP